MGVFTDRILKRKDSNGLGKRSSVRKGGFFNCLFGAGC